MYSYRCWNEETFRMKMFAAKSGNRPRKRFGFRLLWWLTWDLKKCRAATEMRESRREYVIEFRIFCSARFHFLSKQNGMICAIFFPVPEKWKWEIVTEKSRTEKKKRKLGQHVNRSPSRWSSLYYANRAKIDDLVWIHILSCASRHPVSFLEIEQQDIWQGHSKSRKSYVTSKWSCQKTGGTFALDIDLTIRRDFLN